MPMIGIIKDPFSDDYSRNTGSVRVSLCALCVCVCVCVCVCGGGGGGYLYSTQYTIHITNCAIEFIEKGSSDLKVVYNTLQVK